MRCLLFHGWLLLTVLLVTPQAGEAQFLRLGVRFGPTTTDFYDRDRPLKHNWLGIPTLGMTIGGVGQFRLGGWGQIQLEQNISWEGTKGHFFNPYNVNLWYLTTPALLKFKITPWLWVGGGLQAHYLMDVTGTSDVHNEKTPWNGAVVLQVEHVFWKRFACTIRYIHGFASTSIINYVDSEGNPVTYSVYSGRTLQVSLSYSFCQFKTHRRWVEGQFYY